MVRIWKVKSTNKTKNVYMNTGREIIYYENVRKRKIQGSTKKNQAMIAEYRMKLSVLEIKRIRGAREGEVVLGNSDNVDPVQVRAVGGPVIHGKRQDSSRRVEFDVTFTLISSRGVVSNFVA